MAPVSAQETYNYSVAAFGTIGGPLDANTPDPGLGNNGFQAMFAWVTQPRVHVGIRVGQVDFSGERLGSLEDPELTWATIGGEYRFSEGYYESGVFIGLGAFQLEGLSGFELVDETSFGVAIGVTGEFPMTRNLFLRAELMAHYADLKPATTFGFAHIGVGWHF